MPHLLELKKNTSTTNSYVYNYNGESAALFPTLKPNYHMRCYNLRCKIYIIYTVST